MIGRLSALVGLSPKSLSSGSADNVACSATINGKSDRVVEVEQIDVGGLSAI